MEIKEKLRNFILKELCLDGNIKSLTDDEQLIEKGIIDSMSTLTLLAYLDENFGILLTEEELNPKNFATLQSICDLVAQKIGKDLA